MISQTIIEQLGGTGRLSAMTGANNFLDIGNGLQFKFKGSRKTNSVHIHLAADDTYSVTFYKLLKGGLDVRVIHAAEGIYCDQLKPLFESTTGLYLSL